MKRKVLTAIAATSVLLTGATTSISQQVVVFTRLCARTSHKSDRRITVARSLKEHFAANKTGRRSALCL